MHFSVFKALGTVDFGNSKLWVKYVFLPFMIDEKIRVRSYHVRGETTYIGFVMNENSIQVWPVP